MAASFVALSLAAHADTSNAPQGHISPPVAAGAHSANDFYPAEANRLGQEGDVLVEFTVRTDGSVSNVTVAKSSNYPLLDAAAVAATSTWHYLPAMQDGKPVEFQWRAVLKFRKTQGPPPGAMFTVVQAPQDAYPADALAQKLQGATGLTIMLDENGRVANAVVYISSGSPSLDAAALDLAKQRWHFAPATLDGRPIKTVLAVLLNWSLPQSPPAKSP